MERSKVRRISSITDDATSPASSRTARTGAWRPNASSDRVSRVALSVADSIRRRSSMRDGSVSRMRSIDASRLIEPSRLLKSCATPVASVPSDSRRWA